MIVLELLQHVLSLVMGSLASVAGGLGFLLLACMGVGLRARRTGITAVSAVVLLLMSVSA
ncbi:hypothetical protein P2Q00_28055 [Streptomyces coacervatus]|uniref:hypothetical protein n=1 Tax=Streptomyces coacervatus TaxID=647381 RepID=UPI0023DCE9C8|nr:hypothetical protein [Streptomyces coacervatus]MDF2269265.1 hypothetical protein [Streptomyces coacervatus]